MRLGTTLALAIFVTTGCKSEDEKRAAAWQSELEALIRPYQARPAAGPAEIAPEQVKGRKVLIAPAFSGAPSSDEARSAAEVGIVILWSVKSDDVPSRTYEQGIKGYGGQVQLTAWAHPEGKRIAGMAWHCTPPSTVTRLQNVKTGATDGYAEHCGPSRSSIHDFGATLAAGRAPEGSNATDETKKAFDAIAATYAKRLDEAPGSSPLDVSGKKLLLYSADDGATPQLYHNEYLLPAAAYADTPADVGVFGVARVKHEATPSRHYSNGAEGYDGKAELILFAHPSGQVLTRTEVPCHLASEDIVVNVLKKTAPVRCAGDPTEIRAAIEKLVGRLPGK